MSFRNISFILHKPQLSENIGACARALKNFSFNKLIVVNPKPVFPNDKIIATSVGAKDIIKNAKVYESLEKSLNNIDILKTVIEHSNKPDNKCSGNNYDLTDGQRSIQMGEDGLNFLGGVDILVNCAAMRCKSNFTEFTNENIDDLFEVNAKSVFYATREAARVMVSQKSGKILMIGSIDGERGIVKNSLYSTTKVAMHSLTRALAVELGPYGIRTNCIMPGTTESERVKGIHEADPEFAERKLILIPAKKFATPEEMAALTTFIVSDENDFMNGSCIASDGGTLAM